MARLGSHCGSQVVGFGTAYESHNLRRDFRRVTAAAGLGARWVSKELRISFVSMMSYQGVPVEEIARLAGHATSSR